MTTLSDDELIRFADWLRANNRQHGLLLDEPDDEDDIEHLNNLYDEYKTATTQ